MVRRTLHLLVLAILANFAFVEARERGCRDMCFYSQGQCEGQGGTWEFECEMIDPDYQGDCNLDAFCVPAP